MTKFKDPKVEKCLSTFLVDNSSQITNAKVAVDFWNYLEANELKISLDFEEFLKFVQASTLANKRKIIFQADLFILLSLDLPESEILEITNAIQETMFFDLNQNIHSNSDTKDALIDALEKGNIPDNLMKELLRILKWVPEQKVLNSQLLAGVQTNPQLLTCCGQERVFELVNNWITEKNKIMNFQDYSFNLILEKAKAK